MCFFLKRDKSNGFWNFGTIISLESYWEVDIQRQYSLPLCVHKHSLNKMLIIKLKKLNVKSFFKTTVIIFGKLNKHQHPTVSHQQNLCDCSDSSTIYKIKVEMF